MQNMFIKLFKKLLLFKRRIKTKHILSTRKNLFLVFFILRTYYVGRIVLHYIDLEKFNHIITSKKLDSRCTFFKDTSAYFFWESFNKDYLISLFTNILVKDGKKSSSYKLVYNALCFLKKITGLQPIIFLKKYLHSNRLMFSLVKRAKKNKRRVRKKQKNKKVIFIPKLTSPRKQYTRPLKIIFGNLSSINLKKKKCALYKKISYLLLHGLFKKNHLEKIVNLEKKTLIKKYYLFRKEEYFSRYIKTVRNIRKQRAFKLKKKSISKKMRRLSNSKKVLIVSKHYFNASKLFLLNRHNLNLQSRVKLKNKWA